MYATSYHPKALGGSDITASGRKLTKGVVGIDPTIIPYGTQLYVPDYGVGVAADTGAPRNTHYWIDLGYDDDNYVGWHWKTDVYILTPVPERINYLLPEN
jgi:3D (Asp-Asp-Asp) domain-containing protein